MTPDVYGALRTAGTWLAGHWTGLAALGVAATILTVLAWAWRPRDDYRSRNDRIAARRITRHEPHPEPDQPGSNDADLLTCLHILAATNNARKEGL